MSSRLSRNAICAALLASSVGLLGAACSNEDENAALDTPDASLDANASDVSVEVPDASAPDAEARTCSDDGVCQTVLPPNSFLRDVWSAGDGVMWAAGWNETPNQSMNGTVLRWKDAAWTVQLETAGLLLYAVWGSSPTDIWAGGDRGLFHGTGPSSDAITWTKVGSELVTSIWGSSANDVWAVGSTVGSPSAFDGKVLHYRGKGADGGNGWELDPISSSRPATYRKVWGTSANDVWIVGSERFMPCTGSCSESRAIALRGRPDGHGGLTWSDVAMPELGVAMPELGGSELSGGGVVASDRPWLMGRHERYDAIFAGTPKTDGSGEYTWSEESFGTCNGTTYPCRGVWFSRAVWGKTPNDVYLAGDFGQLRHWNGTSFALVKTTLSKIPRTESLFGMWGTSDTDLWIVGDRVALHKVALNNP